MTLEEQRDELIATIKNWPSQRDLSIAEHFASMRRLTHTIDRLAQIQEQINERKKP